MRNLVTTEKITLHGVVDASEGWFAPSGEEDVGKLRLVDCRPFHSGIVLTRYSANR